MELLIDGVRYKLWMPQEEDDLEKMIKEHAKDIFGEDSIYFDIKQTLRSQAGIGSKPDGYVIALGDTPQWYIVEVELSSHPLHEHIMPQMSRFSMAIENPNTQRLIVDATYRQVKENVSKEALVRDKIGAREIHEFLSDLVSNPPVLVVVIEKKTKPLEDVCAKLPLDTKVVEFRTFEREGVVDLAVHAHLFEPLRRPPSAPLAPPSPPTDYIELELKPYMIEYWRLLVPKENRDLFPEYGSKFELETDVGAIETRFDKWGISKGMGKWFRSHPELRVGQKLIIEVIEPRKRYRLKMG